jgi:hypothetical protein
LRRTDDLIFNFVYRVALAVYCQIALTRSENLRDYRSGVSNIDIYQGESIFGEKKLFCREETKLAEHIRSKRFDLAWKEFENLSSIVLKAKWKAIFELVLELLLKETETGILQYPTSERVIYLPGEKRISKLGTPYLFTGFFCLRENYVYTRSYSDTELSECFWFGIGQKRQD